MKYWIGRLFVDDVEEVYVSGKNKENVAELLCEYLAQYLLSGCKIEMRIERDV